MVNEKFTIEASLEHLDEVVAKFECLLESEECPLKLVTKLVLCIEELYVNVASYAYSKDEKQKDCTFEIIIENSEEDNFKKKATISISDRGRQFNPLEKADPDITLSADERPIGGLGIFMVKKTMDKVTYDYLNNMNKIVLEKSW